LILAPSAAVTKFPNDSNPLDGGSRISAQKAHRCRSALFGAAGFVFSASSRAAPNDLTELPVSKSDTPAKVGRPSSFKLEYVEQARKLTLLGATDREVAEFFDVSERTLNTWKHKYPEFLQSLKLGKEASDNRVEKSLYRRAIGYSYDAEKIFTYKGEPVRVPYVEHVPPDTTACIFWLKNRRRQDWRDRVDLEKKAVRDVVTMTDAELEDIIRRGRSTGNGSSN